MDSSRVKEINPNFKYKSGSVIYWMIRDQRVEDNWALIHAQNLAIKYKAPLRVAVCYRPNQYEFNLSSRSLKFILDGLKKVESELRSKNIPFDFLVGDPKERMEEYFKKEKIGYLVFDMFPLKVFQLWVRNAAELNMFPVDMVDAHNIVPVWTASEKQEFGAYTIRPKINRLLGKYLTDFPKISKHIYNRSLSTGVDWAEILKRVKPKKIEFTSPFKSGYEAAKEALDDFIENRIDKYADCKNDPNKGAVSDLSVYLHFGQISAQRVAYVISRNLKPSVNTKSFLEELIVRRELADNYCYYNKNYDSFLGFPDWARRTLDVHISDKRDYVYDLDDFEKANTHDDSWNAAQMQMVKTGKMHGYMRMYWAKKILEWTSSCRAAQEIAIYLNDLYSLDGRDPNGYVGIAWSIGGVHDRAWFERPIFGKVRYMNYNGLKRKFDVEKYIESWIDK